MKCLRRYLMGKLTVDDLVEYFHSMGVGFNFTFEKKQLPVYFAKDSRLYKIKGRK